MAKALLLAWSTPVSPERTAEFNEWYEKTHIPQVREAVAGVLKVSRYEKVDMRSGEGVNRFLAVYEVDTSDVAAASKAMSAAAKDGRMQLSDVMDLAADPPDAQWYRGISEL
jgi:hypothetical protein